MADIEAWQTFTVSTQAQLNAAIQTIDAGLSPGTYTIDITTDITEGQAGQPAGIDGPSELEILTCGATRYPLLGDMPIDSRHKQRRLLTVGREAPICSVA